MHAGLAENVDRTSEGSRYRWDEDCDATIVKFFDNECRDEGIFDLGKGWSPCPAFALTGQSLSKTSQERIARDSLE